jgi:Helix-turn-helix domain
VPRHPNHRLAKIHRSYTVAEIAELLGKHHHTVREWIKRGLPTVDHQRPTLILGRDLSAFLQARRTKNKRSCQAGEIYCVRCRLPKSPAGGMADYQPLTPTLGNLVGICSSCESLMYRRVNLAKLSLVCGNLDVSMPEGLRHIA